MKGKKVVLRPIVRSDLKYLNTWKNDEELYMFLGGGYQPLSVDQQEKWMDSMMDMTGSNRRFMILDLEENPVGMVGLYEINWIHRTCEIGVYIGDFSARGKGLASEACCLLEAFAKEYLNLRKIKLKVVSENVAALNMWKKLGYVATGEFKKERYIKGRYCDVLLMEKFVNSGGGTTKVLLRDLWKSVVNVSVLYKGGCVTC